VDSSLRGNDDLQGARPRYRHSRESRNPLPLSESQVFADALAFEVKTWDHIGWEIALAAMEKIDWSDYPLVEVKSEVQSGAPVLRGTRMPVDAIVDNFDYGVSATEIAEQFEIPPERVEAILTYAQSHRFAHPV
jgi:uncharacterized protein (DUF433 family)